MSKKILWLVASGVMVLSLLVAACGPESVTSPQTTPTAPTALATQTTPAAPVTQEPQGTVSPQATISVPTTPTMPVTPVTPVARLFDPMVLDQSQDDTTSKMLAYDYWQSFTSGLYGELISIEVYIVPPPGTWRGKVNIFAGEGIGGTLLGSRSFTINPPTGGGWQKYVLSAPIVVAKGSKYTFDFDTMPNSGAWTFCGTNSDSYGGGAAQEAGQDLAFHIFTQPYQSQEPQVPVGSQVPSAVDVIVVDQNQDAHSGYVGGSGKDFWQSFTSGLDGQLRSIEVYSAQGLWYGALNIYADEGTAGTLLGSRSFSNNNLPGGGWQKYVLSTPINVTKGSKYTFEFAISASTGNGAYRGTNSDSYSGGTAHVVGQDVAFRIYVAVSNPNQTQ